MGKFGILLPALSPGSQRRIAVRGVAVCVSVAAATSLLIASPTPASAEPVRSSQQLLNRYKSLSTQAEKAAEAMNKAQEDFDKQSKIVVASQKAAKAADRKLLAAQREMADAQVKIDALARASYRGARVNRLYAMLVSDSPQNLLDNMSDLEVISRQAAGDIKSIKKTAKDAKKAKSDAEKAGKDATDAANLARQQKGEVQAKQADLQIEAVAVRAVYASMTGKELAALRGPKYNFDPRSVPKGTSPEMIAVQAAISRIGDPYVWGATGPDQFDCSGLMVWAYKQAGKTLPRTSEAQNAAGTPVSRNDLKPGDLIIYYPDAHHVGMYVGDGYVIHASTFGVPVAVVPLDKAGQFRAARRY
ncbi:MAG: NlpC/P60 family protein [Gordonia sp. (in: high G+C Gram-positive bacteria)]